MRLRVQLLHLLTALVASASPAAAAAAVESLQEFPAEPGDEPPEAAAQLVDATGSDSQETATAAGRNDLPAAPQVPVAAAFTLKPAVETAQPRLYLGDLAVCSGAALICDEAYGIDLGPSPEPGKTQAWSVAKLGDLLSKEWPKAQLQLRGARLSKVTAASTLINEDELLSQLRAHIASLTSTQPDDTSAQGDVLATGTQIDVERLLLASPVRVRPGELSFSFPELTAEHVASPQWQHRAMSGPLRLGVISRPKTAAATDAGQNLAVNVQFSLKEQHWVASRALAKGAILQAEDFSLAWLTAGHQAARYPQASAQLVGRRLRRDLGANAALLTTDVETPRLMKRGQLATLQWQNHGLSVTSQVRLQADASLGQTVEAVYPSTKKHLRVQAIDSRTVQLAD